MVPSPFWKSSSSPVPYDERTTTYRFALVGSGNASNNHAKYCRSEEHTSELQSQSNLVCRLLLEKKKNTQRTLRRGCSPVERLTKLTLYHANYRSLSTHLAHRF